ncbi:MAG TPA: ABC transporter permease, partial [Bryobacteraceae bacterium]
MRVVVFQWDGHGDPRATVRGMLQDLRYAWRGLRRNPGYAAVAVLTLALGTGANTAVYSLIDAVLLRSLPVAGPGRLFLLEDPSREKGDMIARADFERLRARNQVFSGLCSFSAGDLVWNANIGGESEPVRVLLASGSYYDVIGVRARLGRTFSTADDQPPAGNAVALISDAFWQRRFA